ncbi:E3 ubiquitin-protein ligase RMA1H1-like [Gossypium australe]|uniref:E3 ubiquitin-protein ligase RMA n=1 Tax=Gossypium australe TaxID=47621 RepID=A0A5B6V3P4_9ROSI|nr:E3 ubiquitin-protein ligase RMA1H1-like [Gossypium australe]
MIIEQYMESKICLQEWMDSPGSVSVSDDNPSRSFDCNICLDSVQDPVVTFCGHLFCWPCIYKWLSTGNQDQKQHRCPVCKAEVSDTTLIPLYGRGSVTSKESRPKASQFGMVIPKRPPGPTCGVSTIQGSPNTTDHHGYSYQPQAYFPQQDSYPDSLMFSPGGTPINVPDPVIRMFGEMMELIEWFEDFDSICKNVNGILCQARRLAGKSLKTPQHMGEIGDRSVRISRNTRWKKLEMDWYKVNTDGARELELDYAASSGVVRDYNGEWKVGFARKIGVCLVMEVGSL